MKTLEITDDWNTNKSSLKRNLFELTPEDLKCIESKHDKQVHKIQQLTGEPREVVENAIMELVLCGSSPTQFQF